MRAMLTLLAALTLAGCVSGYQQFYKPYVDARNLEDAELLKPDEEPKVYGTNDFDRDIRLLRSRMYVPIGYSSFNGGNEDTKNAAARGLICNPDKYRWVLFRRAAKLCCLKSRLVVQLINKCQHIF